MKNKMVWDPWWGAIIWKLRFLIICIPGAWGMLAIQHPDPSITPWLPYVFIAISVCGLIYGVTHRG